jgi:hypothetical protein
MPFVPVAERYAGKIHNQSFYPSKKCISHYGRAGKNKVGGTNRGKNSKKINAV